MIETVWGFIAILVIMSAGLYIIYLLLDKWRGWKNGRYNRYSTNTTKVNGSCVCILYGSFCNITANVNFAILLVETIYI